MYVSLLSSCAFFLFRIRVTDLITADQEEPLAAGEGNTNSSLCTNLNWNKMDSTPFRRLDLCEFILCLLLFLPLDFLHNLVHGYDVFLSPFRDLCLLHNSAAIIMLLF